MRFVPADGLVEGMIIGKSLYDQNHNLLLREGCTIYAGYVDRIKMLGYQGVYVDDELGADIEVTDIINDEIRMKMIKTIKEVCINTPVKQNPSKTEREMFDKKMQMTKQLIQSIVDQVLENKDAMVNLIDLKFYDDYTFFHSVNVAVLSLVMGAELNLNKTEMYNLGLGAVLHDMGKVFVEKEVVQKQGKLTDEEYVAMKRHSEFGYRFLKETYEIPVAAYVGVLQHHEKFDGSGYPNGLNADSISMIGRIICIADVYDALISNRPYRAALLPSEAMEYVMANGGIMFDLNLTRIFARKVAPFPVGTYVRLSNGLVGIIYSNHEDACMRPIVRVVLDKNGKHIEPYLVNLRDNRDMRNVTVTAVHNL